MKKNLRLALQTSGFVALFALVVSSSALADEIAATEQIQPETEVSADVVADVSAHETNNDANDSDDDATQSTNEATEIAIISTPLENDDTAAVEILDVKPTDSPLIKSKKEERWFKHLQESLKKIQSNPASLKIVFNQVKDPAALVPKALADIAALTNKSEQRIEIYKVTEAAATLSTAVSEDDKTSFMKIVAGIVGDAQSSILQTREMLIKMLLDRNFKYMSEKEIKDTLKALNPQRHHRGHHGSHKHHLAGAPKLKNSNADHKKDKHSSAKKAKNNKKNKHVKKNKKNKHAKNKAAKAVAAGATNQE